MKPLMVGIAGGTCSGKTTLAASLALALPETSISSIQFDSYYRPIGHLSLEERSEVNFDHLDSLDIELFARHLALLREGEGVPVPVYDFTSHTRTSRVSRVEPEQVVIVEGILLLAEPLLVDYLDLKVFLDVDADIRLARRVIRDMSERGRSAQSVIEQYLKSVRPMHELLVEPSREQADLVVYRGGLDPEAIGAVSQRLRELLV